MNKRTAKISIAFLVASLPLIAAQAAENSDTNWTWMKGANTTNQPGNYGTQGVPAADNTPGARYGAVSWTDTDDTLWLFGGYGYDALGDGGYLNDLWKYNPATTNWTWMKGTNTTNQPGTYGTQGVPAAGNTPGARHIAVSWTDTDGAFWLFGGASGNNVYLNDLWKYDPATTNWTWIKGANTTNQYGTYGTQGVPAAGNTPGARFGAISWTDASDTLWLFGGAGYAASGDSGYLNDLWKYDSGTTNWTWMKGANTTNQYGTYGTQGVPAAGNTPGARPGAMSWTDTDNALWLFGGEGYAALGNRGYLNDLWKYNPATTNWTWMKGANTTNQPGTYGTRGVPAADNTPGARHGAMSWTDASGTLWLFGGYHEENDEYLNDLWKYDPATTNWTWIKGANTTNQPGTYGTQGVPAAGNMPGARRFATSWTDTDNALWLFGGNGYAASASGYLNDLWKYNTLGGGILLDTKTLSFSTTLHGATPTAQMVGMTNVGRQRFTYTNVITYRREHRDG